MAAIEVTPRSLVVHVTGYDRILAMKSSVAIPLEHVVAVDQNLGEASTVFHGLKMPGTVIPGVVTAGSFLKSGEWAFWDVHDPAEAIILRLRDEHYARVVVGVNDPDATVAAIRKAIGGRYMPERSAQA